MYKKTISSLLFFSIVLALLIGCDSKKNNATIASLKKIDSVYNIENVNDFLVKDNKIEMMQVFFSEDNCYGIIGDYGNELIKMNINRDTETILTPSVNMGILYYRLYENKIIWVEVDSDYFNNSVPGYYWTLNAMNLDNGEITQIDFKKEINDYDLKKYYTTYYNFPYDVSISDDKVVYSLFDLNDDGEIYQAVKCYDIISNSVKIIDRRSEIDGFFSSPYIENDRIVYSYAVFRENSYLTDSEVYIYDLKNDTSIKLEGDQFINPKLLGDYVVAEKRNDGDVNGMTCYVYNIKKNQWSEVYNYEIAGTPSDLKEHFNFHPVQVLDNKLFITSNLSPYLLCIDPYSNSYSIIDAIKESEYNYISIISSDNNFIFWVTNEINESEEISMNLKKIEIMP